MRLISFAFLFVSLIITGVATAEEEQWIPAAASNPGRLGTMWTTDLWISSLVVDVPIEVSAAFFPEVAGITDPVEVVIEIQPETQIEIVDAVATIFGEHRPGAIRLRSEYPFLAQSRIANDGGSAGNFGQGIPAFSPDSAEEAFNFLGAAQRPGDDGIRSNIGVIHLGDEQETAYLYARDAATHANLGLYEFEIGPNGWFQGNLFELLGLDGQTVELADVGIWCPGSLVLAYLSRIDNRSGDGTFFHPTHAESVRILPRLWQVEATVNFTGSTSIDRVEYTTADGLASIDNPASGFTTEILELWSPTTFCVRAVGEHGPGPGSIEFEVRRRPAEDPSWAGGRSMVSWGGGSGVVPLDEDHCIELD